MEIRVSDVAKNHMQNIFDYHLGYSENFAVKFQMKMFKFFMVNLQNHPELGVVQNPKSGTRKLVFRDYNIYYKIDEGIINILHIFHSKNSLNQNL